MPTDNDDFQPTEDDIGPAGPARVKDNLVEMEQGKLARAKQEADLHSRWQDIELRRSFAGRIYWMIVIWLVGVFGLLVFEAFGWWGFQLSDTVLLAVVGSTTFNVLGIFAIVATYLFPRTSVTKGKLTD